MAVTRMSLSGIKDFNRTNRMSGGTPSGFAVEYLVVAGGGSGSGSGSSSTSNTGGGGGAGGYRSNVAGEPSGGGASAEQEMNLVSGTYSVTVGAGGSGFSQQGIPSQFAWITCVGGGGAGFTSSGTGSQFGGSGAGTNRNETGGLFFPGVPGQGFRGGFGASVNIAGGGGGAGGVGGSGASGFPVDGGAGVTSSINGSSVGRAGGAANPSSGSATDGGGQGITGHGAANTGGGGTGGRGSSAPGNGGSGVVIIRVPTGTPVSFSGGVTSTSSTVGNKTAYTITATSTTSETVTIG